MPEAVLLGVGLDQRDLVVLAAGELQVAQRLVVDREDRARRAVLRAHVADGGAVGERHGADARPVELDELADDAVLAQHLGDREDEVGGGGAVGQLAVELEADDAGDEHADGLAEHRGLGLDAADAPAQHAEAVDHGGVRVGADEGVGVGDTVAAEHDARQVLDVDLVDDAGAGRDDLELVERALAPAQELVALDVALVLELDVAGEGVRRAEQVGDDRVVDHEFGRRQRVDLRGVAAEVDDGLAHGGEVDDGRHAGEVLHHDARGRELDLGVGLGVGPPVAERLDLRRRDVLAVLGAQQVLEQHLQAERQALRALDGIDAVVVQRVVTDTQPVLGPEAVLVRRHVLLHSLGRPVRARSVVDRLQERGSTGSRDILTSRYHRDRRRTEQHSPPGDGRAMRGGTPRTRRQGRADAAR